ncbi:MAG: flagellar motor switch phosphatase FliY [Clostridiales bacterium]|jgi:flagellar motor switch protein FliN/FliY|nr:flagellar motor switch phosphatase FliY [Clostridiales bacterium]
MSDMLSQAEIDALLGGGSRSDDPPASAEEDIESLISNEQKDILGEIGNISMGTAATTLFTLLSHKVLITTPRVNITTWSKLSGSYDRPCVGVRVDYKEGLKGANILVLKEKDVRTIANLMMGGDGLVDDDTPLSELDLSAIGEAMNQMVGSSSTSLSSMIKRKIDIDTPNAFVLDFADNTFFDEIGFNPEDVIVCVSFKMEIGTLINSEIMQILPLEFAQDMVDIMKTGFDLSEPEPVKEEAPMPPPKAVEPPQPPMPPKPPVTAYAAAEPPQPPPRPDVSVQPAQFQTFDLGQAMQQKENIGIIMDVPLEVSVELGRTRKKIKDILEFSPGVIVELDKLAGDPIDILVNGKFVAKGEVVVIDENFGIRITEIVSVEKRVVV